jgi:8-oxo-dGTP pyrophosphatase MutT (NUDIX family)
MSSHSPEDRTTAVDAGSPPVSRRDAPESRGSPAAGEEYNPGPATPPRQAATVILLRGGTERLELLLVKRTPKARFMGGVWVFPGGAVEHATDRGSVLEGSASHSRYAGEDSTDRGRCTAEDDSAHSATAEDDSAHRAAAVRELREEAGVSLPAPAELVKFSRWITPAEVKIRFDTHFFLAPLPPGQEPQVDGEECVELGWFTPRGALRAHDAGEILLVFPTIKHLEQLSAFATTSELLEHARGRAVEPVEPRLVLEGEVARVLLPGEPGY